MACSGRSLVIYPIRFSFCICVALAVVGCFSRSVRLSVPCAGERLETTDDDELHQQLYATHE